MRIALLSYEYPPETGFGGIGTYTYYHAHALSRLGHEVHVFAGSQQPGRTTRDDDGVTVTRFHRYTPTSRLLPHLDRDGLGWFKNRVMTATDMARSLGRELEAQAFDVIEMPECGGEGALLGSAWKHPTVVRFHSPAELIMPTYATKRWDRMMTAWVERVGIRGARALSSCSLWLAEEVRERMGIHEPITVIPNGIDLRRFDESGNVDIHERFGLPADKTKIFFANRLEPRKGIHVVKDLIEPILTAHPDAMFVLAGDDNVGYFEREIAPLSKALGVEDRVRALGKLPLTDVRACVKQCDVFLLASTWENAPYSLLEAMSAGAGIVASDCGGVPEMLRHGIDGLIARTENASDFARALDRMLGQKGLRERLGRSARQRAEARYSADRIAQRSVDFYQWSIGANPGLAPRRRQAKHAATLELGPRNWFQAWWLRGDSGGEAPRLARDEAGEALLAGVEAPALAFVVSLLARVYWQVAGKANSPEASFLAELRALELRVRDAEAQGAHREAAAKLGMPAASHPLFESEALCRAFRDESWHVASRSWFVDWLALLSKDSEFLERAGRLVAARWLLMDAARRDPRDAIVEALGKTYRSVSDHARVVARDRDFIENDVRGGDFERDVEALGLHAPLRRPRAWAKPKRLDIERPQSSEGGAAITVVIPSFKHEAFIEEAIRSALDSQAVDVAVLVADDASPDGTVRVARSIDDPRLTVVERPENSGLGASLSDALNQVETPYVAILNSDDVFHPHRLARCLSRLVEDTSTELVATSFVVMDEKGRRLDRTTASMPDLFPRAFSWVRWNAALQEQILDAQERTRFERLLRANHLVTTSNIVARTAWLRAQVAERRELLYCLDWDLFLEASRLGALAYVDEPLLGYRLHASNTVWFDDTRDVDYLHEVHHVVAKQLRGFMTARLAETSTPTKERAELAAMLDTVFAEHGEVEASELVLALLAGRGAATSDCHDPILADYARKSRRRHVRERAFATSSVDPWLAADWIRAMPRTQAGLRAATLWRERAEVIERRRATLDSENARLAAEREDALAVRDLAIDERQEAIAEREAVEAERDALLAERARVEAEFYSLTGTSTNLSDQLLRTKKHLEDKLTESTRLKAVITEHEARLRRSEERLAAAEQRRRSDLIAVEARWRDKLGRAALDRELERQSAARRIEQRIAKHFEGQRLLGKVVKTVHRTHRAGAERARRFVQKLRGQRPNRVVVPLAGDVPPSFEDLCEFEAWRAAGLDLRHLTWNDVRKRDFAVSHEAFLAGVRSVPPDARLADRAWNELSEDVRATLANASAALDLAAARRAASFAVAAAALQPTFILAHGIGEAAWHGLAAAQHCAVPLVLRVRGADLVRHASYLDAVATLSAAAQLLLVDAPSTATRIGVQATVDTRAADEDAAWCLLPAALPLTARFEAGLVLVPGPLATSRRQEALLATLLATFLDKDDSLRVHVLAERLRTPFSMLAWQDIEWRVATAGRAWSCTLAAPRAALDAFERAPCVIVEVVAELETGLPFEVVQARASGAMVFASHSAELESEFGADAGVVLYDSTAPTGLSDALRKHPPTSESTRSEAAERRRTRDLDVRLAALARIGALRG